MVPAYLLDECRQDTQYLIIFAVCLAARFRSPSEYEPVLSGADLRTVQGDFYVPNIDTLSPA
jgi:hypothetical protein